MSNRPIFVFVPGAWHSPACFQKVITRLSNSQYESRTISMPGVGSTPATQSLEPDIAAVRKAVLDVIEAGQDAILVMHSWGGIPGSCALAGLGKAEREKAGKQGGVIKLVYLCAFVIPEGVGLHDGLGREMPDYCVITGDTCNMQDPISMFYHDVDPEEAAEWVATFRPQSLATFTAKTTGAAWLHIPSVYLIAEDDRAIPIESQDAMIAACRAAGAQMETERVSGAHSPFLMKPDFVVDVLRRAAGESV